MESKNKPSSTQDHNCKASRRRAEPNRHHHKKKETFRLKIIKKTLAKNANIWVDYFMEQLSSCGKSGLFNLCQTLPQNHYNSLEPFMREVMIAWKKMRPWFKINVKNAEHILCQPLCYNVEITNNGKPILSQFFEKAGIINISDILDTNRNISCAKVLDKLQNNKVKHRRKIVKTVSFPQSGFIC